MNTISASYQGNMPISERKNVAYKKGLVSVIIPTYKRCDMLIRAIRSVLDQTYENIELIVVNDNEKNDEWSIQLYDLIGGINDERLRFIEQEKHINGAVARNVGIRQALGEYIAFLDDDDYWAVNKIELQIKEFLKLDDSWGGVSCLKKVFVGNRFKRATLPYRSGFVFYEVITSYINITTGTILIRHTALDDAGYFDENLTRSQDIQLFSFLSKKYKIKLLKRHLLVSDVSDNQNRPNAEKSLLIEKNFIQSISPLLSRDNYEKVTRRIDCSVQYNIGVSFIREKQFIRGMRYIFKSLICPGVFIRKTWIYFKSVQEIIFKKAILKHYDKN